MWDLWAPSLSSTLTLVPTETSCLLFVAVQIQTGSDRRWKSHKITDEFRCWSGFVKNNRGPLTPLMPLPSILPPPSAEHLCVCVGGGGLNNRREVASGLFSAQTGVHSFGGRPGGESLSASSKNKFPVHVRTPSPPRLGSNPTPANCPAPLLASLLGASASQAVVGRAVHPCHCVPTQEC